MKENEMMTLAENNFFNDNMVMYSSMKCETHEEKKNFYNAINSPDEVLAEHIGEVIEIKDVFCEPVELQNETTGEYNVCPRVILVDTKGKTYQAVSTGIYNALTKIIKIFGSPTWEKGLKVKVKQITKQEKRILTLDVI